MIELPLPVIGIIATALFLILAFLRMHIGVAMLIGGFVGIILSRSLPAALSTISTVTFRIGSSEYLAVIPLFMLMGIIAGTGDVTKGAFLSFYKWFGHLRGGLAMAAIGACAAFGAVCGNNIATAATVAKIASPEMKKYGYSDQISVGAIAAGGNLGILIPPSGAFVVYGFVTQTSIGALFISGILPGLVLTAMMIATIYILCKINPSLAEKGPKASWKEQILAIKGVIGIVVVFLLVMGGLLRGFFTPSEAGAVGVIAVILVNLAYKHFNVKEIGASLVEACKYTAMIMALIFGAMVFSTFLTTSEISFAIADYIVSANLGKFAIMFIIMAVYILLGCIMDIWALLIITLPIFFPIVMDLGFDPLQFGVLCILCIMIGCITPPVGIVVYALSGMLRDVPLNTIFRGVTPFLVTMILFMIILVFVPKLSTVLPDLMIVAR